MLLHAEGDEEEDAEGEDGEEEEEEEEDDYEDEVSGWTASSVLLGLQFVSKGHVNSPGEHDMHLVCGLDIILLCHTAGGRRR